MDAVSIYSQSDYARFFDVNDRKLFIASNGYLPSSSSVASSLQ